MHISVQQATFDLGAQVNDFTSAQDASGAVVTFTGIVRDLPQGGLQTFALMRMLLMMIIF